MSNTTSAPKKMCSLLEDQLTLVRRTLAVKQKLKRVQQERDKAQIVHQEQCERGAERIEFLQAKLQQRHSSMQSNSNLTVYRRALTEQKVEDDGSRSSITIPPRYVLEKQAKLLSYFHRTEVYRNQWELVSTFMIRTTRYMMCEASILKDEKTLAATMLAAAIGNHSNKPPSVDFSKAPQKESIKRSRRGSILGGQAAHTIITLSSAAIMKT